MEDDFVAIYDYRDPSSDRPDWVYRGTLEHIAALGLEPVMATRRLVLAVEIDETGKYRPERGTGQQ